MPPGRILQFCRDAEGLLQQILLISGEGIGFDVVRRLPATFEQGDFITQPEKGEGLQSRLDMLGRILVKDAQFDQSAEPVQCGGPVDAILESEDADAVHNKYAARLLERKL